LLTGAGTNVYHFENCLVAAGRVKIVYDGDGKRVRETVACTGTADQDTLGTRSRYTWTMIEP